MNSTRKSFALVAFVATITVSVLTGCSSTAGTDTGSTAVPTVRMATEPWIGYGPWWIAKDQGLFAKNGLNVEQTTFNADADLNAAFVSGKMDVANVATHTALRMLASGVKLKVVMIEDVSMTADSIVSPAGITTVKQLKGKDVAYEKGTTSDLLLNYALAQNDMTIADINPVPMAAADAGAALIGGKVTAAVTYEPYITTALAQGGGYHRLFTAGKQPGLISDVLIVSEAFAKKNPSAVTDLTKAWGLATNYYNTNSKSGRAIISAAVSADAASLSTAFDGVKLYTLADNQKNFSGAFLKTTVPLVMKAAIGAGILEKSVDFSGSFDGTFLGK